ncbi:MAG: DUF6390 family protein [bacterium]
MTKAANPHTDPQPVSSMDFRIHAPITATDGVARCARYGFGPNKLHLCGPDANSEVFAYIKADASDPGLSRMLTGFQTLYPYLKTIASANGILDPFDSSVVEAYWIGNALLENIPEKIFYHHLAEGLRLKDRYGNQLFDRLAAKLSQGARMHHSFHVFNAQKTDGTLENMDACRVSWGKVVATDGPTILMKRRPLLLLGHQLALGKETEYSINRALDAAPEFDDLIPGQWVTMHWYKLCEVIPEQSTRWLEKYTTLHIALANQTL